MSVDAELTDNDRRRDRYGHELLGRIAAADLLEAVPDACIIADTDGMIRACNDRATSVFGHAKGSLVGRSVEDLVPDPLRDRHASLRAGYALAPGPRPMGLGLGLHAEHADGHRFPVEISLSPIDIGAETYVIATVRDETAPTALREQIRRIQHEAAVVAERERLGRDLHDTVIQQLFAIGLRIQALAGRADDDVSRRLEQSVDDLDHVIAAVRTAIFEGVGRD